MNTGELLRTLRDKSLEAIPEGNRLRVRGPSEALTPELIAELRAHKAELLRALAQPVPTTPCPTCGGLRYWLRPNGGWLCQACHPAPTEGAPEVVALRDMQGVLRKATIELAEAAGWPRLALDGYRLVLPLRSSWVAFARASDVPTLQLAIARLREGLGGAP